MSALLQFSIVWKTSASDTCLRCLSSPVSFSVITPDSVTSPAVGCNIILFYNTWQSIHHGLLCLIKTFIVLNISLLCLSQYSSALITCCFWSSNTKYLYIYKWLKLIHFFIFLSADAVVKLFVYWCMWMKLVLWNLNFIWNTCTRNFSGKN